MVVYLEFFFIFVGLNNTSSITFPDIVPEISFKLLNEFINISLCSENNDELFTVDIVLFISSLCLTSLLLMYLLFNIVCYNVIGNNMMDNDVDIHVDISSK